MPEPGSLSEVADPNHHPRERVPRQGHRRAEHESAQRPPELSAPAGRERDDGHVDQDEVRSGKHQQPGQHADAQPPAEQRRPDEPHHEGDREVGLQADRRVEQRARQQDSHAEPRHEPTIQPGVASEGVQPEGSGSGRRDEQDTGRRTGACSKKVNAASSHTFSGLVAVFAEIPSTNAHCSCRARFLA